MMTDVLLGSYPDVFKAGSAFNGRSVPLLLHRHRRRMELRLRERTGQQHPRRPGATWCAPPTGLLSGARPRMELWHGTADGTLNYNNFGEEIKQGRTCWA